jgi:predicted component of type VI protein secretion system
VSHTAVLIKSEVLEVIEKIGSEKFAAIVSDNTSAVAAARQRISDTYPHIMNIRCIAHFVNLISKDILGKCLFS